MTKVYGIAQSPRVHLHPRIRRERQAATDLNRTKIAMAVYSMTGYASAQSALRNTELDASNMPQLRVELRSVNNRFLDLHIKLPETLNAAEPQLRERLSQQLRRGKIDVRVHIERRQESAVAEPSASLLQDLADAQSKVHAVLPAAAGLSVAQILQWAQQAQPTGHDLGPVLLEVLSDAIASLKDARQREGARLAAMLQDRVAALRELTQQAAPLIPELIEEQRVRFLSKFTAALGDGAIDASTAQDRALSEAAAFAIRIDVAEELTRLDSHLSEIESLLSKGGELGKRLDFLIQELHREANTLGSKSSTLALSRISVDMKVLIEQMREQVQNIE